VLPNQIRLDIFPRAGWLEKTILLNLRLRPEHGHNELTDTEAGDGSL